MSIQYHMKMALDAVRNRFAEVVPAGGVITAMIAGGAVTLDKVAIEVLSVAYPVGSLYLSVSDTSPATTFGFGTWVAFAQGQALIGAGTFTDSNSEARTFAAGGQAGEYSHTLTEAEMPSHIHPGGVGAYDGSQNTGGSAPHGVTSSTGSTGGDGAHNNIQPSIAVYIWQRTA
jgi:hypothetical protein